MTRVRRASLETLAHQELPFERLVDALQVRRDLSRSPVFQVVLNVVNIPAPQAEMASLRLSGVKIDADTTKFDLTLEVLESERRAALHLRVRDGAVRAGHRRRAWPSTWPCWRGRWWSLRRSRWRSCRC